MNPQIATNPSQSQRLIASGVDPKTADMFWRLPLTLVGKRNNEIYLLIKDDSELWETDTPAWSTSRILELLPKSIKDDNGTYAEVYRYGLSIYPFMGGWQVDYQYCEDDECHSLVCVYGATPIEAIVKAIEWLTKEGYKLNQIEV